MVWDGIFRYRDVGTHANSAVPPRVNIKDVMLYCSEVPDDMVRGSRLENTMV